MRGGTITLGIIGALLALIVARPALAAALGPQALYASHCASCHGDALEGGQFGPSLKSGDFVAKWKGKRGELHKFIAASMPPGGAGHLSDGDYGVLTELIVRTSAMDGPGSARQRVGYLGPKPAPELFVDPLSERARATQTAKLAALTPVTPAILQAPPPGDWLSWRGTPSLTGFSPLDQINRETAGKLTLKWSWSMKPGRNELAPLVHDGVMFVQNAEEVQALDAATGTPLWRYQREIAAEYRGPFYQVQRSFALYGRMVIVATPDRHVVALDMASGKPLWDSEIVPPELPNVLLSSGPSIAGDVIVQGTSFGPFCKGGCYVVGLDPATGRKLWRFDTVAKSGQPGDSWNGLPPEERTGAAMWVGSSYDPKLDLLYLGTAGTYDASSLLDGGPSTPAKSNAALYTDSTIALRPRTGELVWHHQHFPREVWDLDEAFERTLVTLPVKGAPREAVVSIGKIGILDALDRKDGRYLFSIDLGLQNIVTAIDPRTGRRSIDPAKVPARDKPLMICPSIEGVRNWMATAYNPTTGILYVPVLEPCMDFVRTVGDDGQDGKLDIGWIFRPRPGSDGMHGRIQAIDLVNRKLLWSQRSRALPAASLLATAGGVIFTGDTHRSFAAIDDRDGRTLWQTRLNANPSATPVTFTVDGRQYVAVVTGGGGGHDIVTPDMTPEETPGAASTTVWVFGL